MIQSHLNQSVWTAADLARYLKISVPACYVFIKRHQLPRLKWGSRLRFVPGHVFKWLKSNLRYAPSSTFIDSQWDPQEPLWTIADFAAYFRTSVTAAYPFIHRHSIPHVSLGSNLRFLPCLIRALVDRSADGVIQGSQQSKVVEAGGADE